MDCTAGTRKKFRICATSVKITVFITALCLPVCSLKCVAPKVSSWTFEPLGFNSALRRSQKIRNVFLYLCFGSCVFGFSFSQHWVPTGGCLGQPYGCSQYWKLCPAAGAVVLPCMLSCLNIVSLGINSSRGSEAFLSSALEESPCLVSVPWDVPVDKSLSVHASAFCCLIWHLCKVIELILGLSESLELLVFSLLTLSI